MTTIAPDERRTATHVLVIGTGAAGLRAAIELAESGVLETSTRARGR